MSIPDKPNIAPASIAALVNSALPGPNYILQTAPITTTLNIPAWESYRHIVDPMDPSLVDQLQWGFPTGAPIDADIAVPFTNHKTARQNPHIVEQYINKHLQSGAIYGPFASNPLDIDLVVSPLQVAFSASGKPRVCNDLSFGDHSVNSYISADWSTYPGYTGDLTLPKVDDLVKAIMDIGPSALLWKTDFSAFYKQLNTDPAQINTLGFAYAGSIYIENRLPFGLRSACLNAQRVTNAAIRIYRTKSGGFAIGYVDDCVGASRPLRAVADYDSFIVLSDELGLLFTLEKCVRPVPCLVWIGLEFDAPNMCLRIPPDKKARIIAALREWLDTARSSKSHLQSLLGSLNHATSAIVVGRAFTGHILDLIKSDQFPVALTREFYLDVELWLRFLQSDMSLEMTFKCPADLPCDCLVSVAVHRDLVALKIGKVVTMHQISDPIPAGSEAPYVYAFWLATKLACQRLRGCWLTCYVSTQCAADAINRARNVSPALRPMVRHTWWLQASHDMAIRAIKGACDREIDRMVRSATVGDPVSVAQVPCDYLGSL